MRNKGFGMFLILILLVLSFLLNNELEECQTEVKDLNKQIEQLRQEQYQLQMKIESFLNKWNVEIFEVTAYSPYDDKNGLNSDGRPHITSTGTKPAPGTVAVNPKIIPYGTRLWVQGYGWGQALDTGGMIRVREDLIDVFHWTYEEAMKWGRRKAVVVWQN